jgi:hypothetical protein
MASTPFTKKSIDKAEVISCQVHLLQHLKLVVLVTLLHMVNNAFESFIQFKQLGLQTSYFKTFNQSIEEPRF